MKNKAYYCTFDKIIGSDTTLKDTIERAKIIKDTNTPVVIIGDTGTGKDLIARSIHFEGSRRDENFVPINCASIPDNLIESILFGYEEGAFTGSRKNGMPGELELVNGGTLFLDEVGDMSLDLQSKLLRVLETKHFRRLGGTKYINTDFRLISATNKTLHKLVEENKFRQDLLYRINTIPLYLPPLSKRGDDMEELAEYFLANITKENKLNILGFTEDVINIFKSYKWHGNIRELKNVVEYACNFCREDFIDIKHLPDRFSSSNNHGREFKAKDSIASEDKDPIIPRQSKSPDLELRKISDLEKKEIQKGLYLNKSLGVPMEKIASDLGISITTLYRKIKLYDI